MKLSNRKYAIVAGISLITMGLAAGYAYGYVHENLVVDDNATSTANNLLNAKTLFGSGVLAWLLILMADLVVAWCLFRFFLPTHRWVSATTGIIRGVYSAALGLAIYQLATAWQMLYAHAPQPDTLQNLLDDFDRYWSLGLILFGFHLIGLGYLSIKSNSVPKWIGILLYVAGISYSCIHGAKAILPGAESSIEMAEMILGAPMAIAELGLAVWLLWKGGKQQPR